LANFYTTGTGAKTKAQILAAALAAYSTSTTLAGGTYASKYGFRVSSGGSGLDTVHLGGDAPAFGNRSTLTVLQMLQSMNAQAVNGVPYANSPSKASYTNMANDAFSYVNSAGDISLLASGSALTASTQALLDSFDQLSQGTLAVYVDNSNGCFTPDEQARIDDAIASINADLSEFGVQLVEASAENADTAAVVIHMADTTDLGGVAEGVLGVTEMGGDITLVVGWNWFTGSDSSQIAFDQFDYGTVIIHELSHAIGLGHSTDTASVMFPYLSLADVRHDFSIADLTLMQEVESSAPQALRVDPKSLGLLHASEGTAMVHAAVSCNAYQTVAVPRHIIGLGLVGQDRTNDGLKRFECCSPLGSARDSVLAELGNERVADRRTEPATGLSDATRQVLPWLLEPGSTNSLSDSYGDSDLLTSLGATDESGGHEHSQLATNLAADAAIESVDDWTARVGRIM
jgi:hypothetical protein